jgi:glycogen operon protein
MRNFLTMLFFSRGVPMIASGDEFGRTQDGNNNPWNLNTIGMWNNYAMAGTNRPTSIPVDPENPNLCYHNNFGTAECDDYVNPFFRFTTFVTQLRNQHKALRQRHWGDFTPDDNDVSYFYSNPHGDTGPAAEDRCLRIYIDGSGIGDCDFLVMINMWTTDTLFGIPTAEPGKHWARIIDTASWAESYCNCWYPNDAATIESTYSVHPWSIAVLQLVNH